MFLVLIQVYTMHGFEFWVVTSGFSLKVLSRRFLLRELHCFQSSTVPILIVHLVFLRFPTSLRNRAAATDFQDS